VSYDYLTTPTGERIVVESRGDTALGKGTQVVVEMEEGTAMFFDAETELRLR
jgi:lactose/L-arabinose transport system ATP-binding protein